MLREVGRGVGPFEVGELHFDNRYYEDRCDKEVYGFCHIQLDNELAHVHLYMRRWSKVILVEMRADFEALKKELRRQGVKALLGTHKPEGADKWFKFLKLFGFDSVTETTTKEGQPCSVTMMEV
ncbi:MAG: hypothetical protein KAR06_00195 [Deltaproteobacteria bacterium]|nr:hypothetical protein [Deltaproteobacteria bacterium]